MIIFHIGLSKAGSSSLQALLSQAHGVHFINKPNVWLDKGKRLLDNEFFDKVDAIGKNKTVFISHEHMIMPISEPQTGISIVSLEHAKILLNRINKLSSKCEVLILNRDPFSIIQSRYLQYIIQGGSMSPEMFLDHLIFTRKNKFEFIDYRNSTYIDLLSSAGMNSGRVYDTKTFLQYKNLVSWLKKYGIFITRIEYENLKSKNVGVSYFTGKIITALNSFFILKKETSSSPPITKCCYKLWFRLIHGFRYIDNHIHTVFKLKRSNVFSNDLKRRLRDAGHL